MCCFLFGTSLVCIYTYIHIYLDIDIDIRIDIVTDVYMYLYIIKRIRSEAPGFFWNGFMGPGAKPQNPKTPKP